jgi:hypothetical protein
LEPVVSFLPKEKTLEAYWLGESFRAWRAEDESLGAWRVSEKAQRRIGWRRRKAIGVEAEMEVEGQRSGLPDWRVNASITSRWHLFATTGSGGFVEGARIKNIIGRHEACTDMTLPIREQLGVEPLESPHGALPLERLPHEHQLLALDPSIAAPWDIHLLRHPLVPAWASLS